MLEKMDAFFEARLEGYDQHMLSNIESAQEFYPFTASLLPQTANANILDLGCGTGLELEYYLPGNSTAQITGIDLTAAMLNALQRKFHQHKITTIHGSYFDVPFGTEVYDAAVSVESLHHFTQAEKRPLYQKLYHSLKKDGFFILTDYFADTDMQEHSFRNELLRLKQENGINDQEFYHYDTPLTVSHETEALLQAGFACVEIMGCWGPTRTLKATK